MATRQILMNREGWRQLAVLVAIIMLSGCTESAMRYQNQDDLEDALEKIKLVREMTAPYGGHPTQVDTVALVGGLGATGSDPPPNAYRTLLLTEMQRREVEDPSVVLKSPSTVLAIVKAQLPAGIQKGETFDVEVFIPHDDLESTSLRDGVMYEARLAEHKVLGGRFHEGNVVAVAKGPVLVDPLADPQSEPAKLRRGLILGGGKALESRPLGLMIRPEYKDARLSQRMGAAINRRFYLSRRGIKEGVAKPKTDSYIELVMHPRYANNLNRYMDVVRSIAVSETQVERPIRLQYLKRQLMNPMTAAKAAVQLEAIGIAAKDELKSGMNSTNPEVRFYSAEALAYLDDPAAAQPLAMAARSERAFRALALTALGAMDEPAARDELIGLLNDDSAETRYGAFRAIWAMNRRDPLVRGEILGGKFSYHHILSDGPVMIHMTRSFRPEIVMFGPDQPLKTPLMLKAGKYIHVNSTDSGSITVTRFTPGQADQQKQVPATLDHVIRAIVDLGGSYSDVVQAIAVAKRQELFDCRLEIDAVPKRGRVYTRDDTELAQLGQDLDTTSTLSQLGSPPRSDGNDPEDAPNEPPAEKSSKKVGGWPLSRPLDRILNQLRN